MSQTDPGPARGSEEYLVGLERRIAEQRKEIQNLRQRLHDEGEGKEKANRAARRRIANLERLIGQQAVALDRQYHGLRALKESA